MIRREDYERRGVPKPVPARSESPNGLARPEIVWHGEVEYRGVSAGAVGITVTARGITLEVVVVGKEEADDLISRLIAARNAAWPQP
jgi:hypothetical protein